MGEPCAVCLRAATTLCHGSETSALRCLVTKVRSGDASVPEECSSALKQQLPTRQQQQHQQQKGGSRKQSLMRLLTEVPTFACHKRPTVACQTACPAGSAGGPQQCTSGCKCTSYVDCVLYSLHDALAACGCGCAAPCAPVDLLEPATAAVLHAPYCNSPSTHVHSLLAAVLPTLL